MVSLLLDKGARVNTKNRGGLTPMWQARSHRNVKIADMLLAKGAIDVSPEEIRNRPRKKQPDSGRYLGTAESMVGMYAALGSLEAAAPHCATRPAYKDKFKNFDKNVLQPAGHDVELIGKYYEEFENHRGTGQAAFLDSIARNRKTTFYQIDKEFK